MGYVEIVVCGRRLPAGASSQGRGKFARRGRHMRRTTSHTLLAVGTAVAITLIGSPAQASPEVTTVATGLDNPRGLGFAPNGALYVAEAGRGGDGPCFPGPEGDGSAGAPAAPSPGSGRAP